MSTGSLSNTKVTQHVFVLQMMVNQRRQLLFVSVPSFHYQVLNLVLEVVCELLEQIFVC